MKTWSQVILVNLALTAVGLRVWLDPWPALGEVALLDLVHATDPFMYAVFAAVYIATPRLGRLYCRPAGPFNLADMAGPLAPGRAGFPGREPAALAGHATG